MVDPTDRSELQDLVASVLGRRVGPLQPLGAGADHVTYAVDELVVRVPAAGAEASSTDVDREVRLLRHLASRLPGLVPEVVAADPATGTVVLSRLAGCSLLELDAVGPGLAQALQQVLVVLDDTTDDAVAQGLAEPDPYPVASFLEDAVAALPDLDGELPAGAGDELRRFLSEAPPPEPILEVLCHNDLGAEHLFVDPATQQLTGIIDWADAALTDPARDLGRLHRDLGPSVVERIVAGLRYRDDEHLWRRIRLHAVCSLVEDLVFGLEEDPRYLRAALANLDRTLGV